MESSLKNYRVGVCIGQGSFGTVYHAIHKETNIDVAMKLFDKVSLQKYPHQLHAVLNEQRLLRKLVDCPYAVTLLASFHDDHYLYLALECYKKGTLSHWMEQKTKVNKQLLIHHVIQWTLTITTAIEAIHGNDIIHADLKPDNILITEDLRKVVITDFGSAVSISPNEQEGIIRPTNATGKLTVRGTAEYAAPELIQEPFIVTKSADLWSFGCIIHALWTGQSPFYAESEALIVDKVVAYTNGDSAIVNIGDPIPINNLIKQLLDPLPQQRPTYDVIRSIMKSTDEFRNDSNQDEFTFAIADPKWIQESTSFNMKDGALGWEVFL